MTTFRKAERNMEPGHSVSSETLRIIRNTMQYFSGRSEGRLLSLETIVRLVEKFIAQKRTLPATIQQINDTFGWTVREGEKPEFSYPYHGRSEFLLETDLGVQNAYVTMYDGKVVEIVIPLISYDSDDDGPLWKNQEKKAFITNAFVETYRSIRMFLGSRDKSEPGKYPSIWWCPFSTLAVSVHQAYNNVELRLLDINEMYDREEIDRGERATNREMGHILPPDSTYVPITVPNWDELQRRLMVILAELEGGANVTIRHGTTKIALNYIQGSYHKRKMDVLRAELIDATASGQAWMTEDDMRYLQQEVGWVVRNGEDGKDHWIEELVWPESLQTMEPTGEEIVAILHRLGATQPTDLEVYAYNMWEDEKLELKGLTG